jgi:TRAP transporter TAXI family solute receptor
MREVALPGRAVIIRAITTVTTPPPNDQPPGPAEQPTVTYSAAPVEPAATIGADVRPGAGNAAGADVTRGPGTDSPADTSVDQLPRRFGEYELLEVLGRGGMGIVYKARQVNLDRLVAVKMIRDGHLASPADVQRFYLEAQAAGKLSHPNVVAIHEVDELQGHHFFSMDYIEGGSLADLLRLGPVEPQRAARYLKTIAEAIDFAHQHRILHRDLKPANVLIDRDDQPHITDFGLAKRMGQDSGLTASGAAVGTPSYMSPEQAAGSRDDLTPATDVYSLGAILYALLTGQPPFRRDSAVDTIIEVLYREPLPPRALNPLADRDLETICLKCLRKRPSHRYATAQELADELERFLKGEPILAKPAGRAVRLGRWLRQIPMIAAVTGGRTAEPTAGQRRANVGLIVCTVLFVLGWALWRWLPQPLPRRVHIASAAVGGVYHEVGEAYARVLREQLGRPVEVLVTSGSVDNAQRLAENKAELALLQENAIVSDRIAVVAPLYYDVVHFVVRQGSGVTQLDQLCGHHVSLGAEGSGMRLNALTILAAGAKLTPAALGHSDSHFTALREDDSLVGAIVTTASRNADLRRLLEDDRFQLIGFDELLVERLSLACPSFRPFTIHTGAILPASAGRLPVPPSDLRTVATTNFLAARRDASPRLIAGCLAALYADEPLCAEFGLIAAREAANWRGFAFHPTARRFFDQLLAQDDR